MKQSKAIIFALLVIATATGVMAVGSAVRSQVLTITIGTDSALDVSQDLIGVDGYIKEIKLIGSTNTGTGALSIVVIQSDTSFGNVTLLTETNVSGEITVRPRIDNSNIGGGALTGDQPEAYLAVGDTVRFLCTTSTVTGVTYKALIKWEKPSN